MTDDLDALGPGPALDAIVARDVFGLDVLGEWPGGSSGGVWTPAKIGSDRPVRPVYLQRCVCDRSGVDCTASFAGVPRIYGHQMDCLDVVPRYSDDPVACALVVKACRDTGWWDSAAATPSGFVRRFDRHAPTFWGGFDALGPDEYAVACVAAIRVARLVGGPLVKVPA